MQSKEIPYAGSYYPSSNDEASIADRLIEFIGFDPDPFGRDTTIGHVTASAFVVDPTRSKVLLTYHRKLQKWLQLGGHCDGIRDPMFVAKKEAYEESGLKSLEFLSNSVFDIDIHTIPANPKEDEHLHFDVRYLIGGKDDEPLHVSDESLDLKWIPLDQLETYSEEPSLLKMREKLPGICSSSGS